MGSSMEITFRQFGTADLKVVSDFLIRNFKPGNQDGNWLQPAWDYMHSHPSLDESALGRIRIWEDARGIIGVTHYESRLGEAFFQVRYGHNHLKSAMLEYAENHFRGETESGERYLRVYINDFDREFESIAKSRGYELAVEHSRPVSELTIPKPIPKIELPEGFHLKSLADDNNLRKIHRVLWRGFNHTGEPPEEGIEDRKKMQSSPNFRKDLTIVVEGPAEHLVSFCGMWYESVNRIAYVEPVATDPEFRRMGLAKAAVWEGIRVCVAQGATVAYVGSDQEFYRAIGFTKRFDCRCWLKKFAS